MNKAHLKALADSVTKRYEDFLQSIEKTNLFEKPLTSLQKK